MRDVAFIKRLQKVRPGLANHGFQGVEGARQILAFEKKRAADGIPCLRLAPAMMTGRPIYAGITTLAALCVPPFTYRKAVGANWNARSGIK